MLAKLLDLAKPAVKRFPKASLAYRAIRDAWPFLEPPQRTPLGFLLAGNIAMQRGTFEPEESWVVERVFSNSPPDLCVNVGANVGYYTCLARHRGVPVVAFEPDPANLRYLLANVRANGWDRDVEVIPMAVCDHVGAVDLYGGGTGASLVAGWAGIPTSYSKLVPASTLDILISARCVGRRVFVLVDVEGAELRVLDGAGALLTQDPRPTWMVEIAVSEHQPGGRRVNPALAATFARFWDQGYEARTADRRLRVVTPVEIAEVARSGIDNLGTHNFIFAEPARMLQLAPNAK